MAAVAYPSTTACRASRGIVIVAGGVEETFQVPALILQRVGEFVGKHHGLRFRRNPVRDEHGLALGIIEARGLFGVKADQKLLQVEVPRHQAKGAHQGFLRVDFRRRHLFVQVLGQVFFDFRPADDLLLERRLDGQARNLAHLLKNFVGLRKEVLGRLLLCDG